MRSSSIHLGLICALAATYNAEYTEPSCDADSAADTADDHCQFLQTNVKPVGAWQESSHDQGHDKVHVAESTDTTSQGNTEPTADAAPKDSAKDSLAHATTEGSAEASLADATVKTGAEVETEGIPSWMKSIASAVGGVDKLEKDFVGLKTSVVTFGKEVHDATMFLTRAIKSTMTIEQIVAQVQTYDRACYTAAAKLVSEITKVIKEFMTGIDKIAPPKFKSALNATLSKVSAQAHIFADSFSSAAHSLKHVNSTMVCQKVSHSLHSINKKVSALIMSATGMTASKMSKDLVEAKELLPSLIKSKVEEVLKKATDAFEQLQSSLLPAVKEILHGTSVAFKGHCTGLPSGAGRLEVGLLSALVVIILSVFA